MLLRRIFHLNSGPEVLLLDLPNTMLLGDLSFSDVASHTEVIQSLTCPSAAASPNDRYLL